MTSMLGIALGVTALITVLSVMNGFEKELRDRILGMASHATVSTYAGKLPEWEQLSERLAGNDRIVAMAP